ncbi:YolD-like family protein [Bacillus testis]|uniref:YolD-like family protein n=1 Tax=Bacillus testis TaxID=1622072 RepID=UPI00067E6E80|nr:YolD-like family protein [Bacillus testis]
MIRDRGRIKWVSMMLPEHVAMLREWAEEDTYEQKAELDEQQMEELDRAIAEAMEYSTPVVVTYFQGNKHRFIMGNIHHVDAGNKKLHLVDSFDEAHYIELGTVVDIRPA